MKISISSALLLLLAASLTLTTTSRFLVVGASPSSSTTNNSNEDEQEDCILSRLHKDSLTKFEIQEYVNLFENWMEKYEKSYQNIDEKVHRMMIWLDNHLTIEEHNNEGEESSYELGHNQHSDKTHDEFLQYYKLGPYSPGIQLPPTITSEESNDATMAAAALRRGGRSSSSLPMSMERKLNSNNNDIPSTTPAPTSIDWVSKGAVTSVKDQGDCGSCWAFSAIGSIEGMTYLNTATLKNLSVQEFVDCDKLDLGCMGGYMVTAFRWEEGTNGICTWEDYKYTGHKGSCQMTNCTKVKGSEIGSFINATNTEEGLVAAIAIQPTSVAMHASNPDFQLYKSGLYTKTCGSELDHGVLAVGYDTTDDTNEDYWVIKNSWGASWGEDGYFRLPRGPEYKDGQCGIHKMATRAVAPTAKKNH